MIKPIFFLLIGMLAVAAIIIIYRKSYSHVLKNLRIEMVTVNNKSLTLEIVSTPVAIRQGLSGRDSMPLDHGMLFEMGEPAKHPFWMKGMKFSLDIIWLRKGVVVDIATNMPAPKVWEIPARHTPREPADRVLELNAGQAEVYGLRIGGTVNF